MKKPSTKKSRTHVNMGSAGRGHGPGGVASVERTGYCLLRCAHVTQATGDDVALTARLVEAGALMGIAVVDHMILAGAKYRSFKEMGRL